MKISKKQKGDSIYSPVKHRYILNKRKNIFNLKRRNTIYIPLNETQRNFLKQYIKQGKKYKIFKNGGKL